MNFSTAQNVFIIVRYTYQDFFPRLVLNRLLNLLENFKLLTLMFLCFLLLTINYKSFFPLKMKTVKLMCIFFLFVNYIYKSIKYTPKITKLKIKIFKKLL